MYQNDIYYNYSQGHDKVQTTQTAHRAERFEVIIMKKFAVELAAQPGAMDNFVGTYDECVAWCKDNGYGNWDDENGTGAKINEIEIDEKGCWTFCYEEYPNWE